MNKRILLVAPQSPFGECSGARQRTVLFYEALKSLAPTDVLVVTQSGRPDVEADGEHDNVFHVGSTRRSMTLSPYAPDVELTARVNALLPVPLERYGLVVGRYLWCLCQLALPPAVSTVVDLDDFRYRFDREALVMEPRAWVQVMQRRIKERLARNQLRRFSGLVFASPLDQVEVPGLSSVVVPNVFPVLGTANVRGESHGGPLFLFVGSMWYGPNRDGIAWFLRHVWPDVRSACPQARLLIVGAAPAAQRQGWERIAGVSAPGFVDDLAQAYADATAVVVPVLYGGGTNIKLLEALAMGKPCVASAFSHRPFREALHHGRDLFVANDARSFVAHCVALIEAPAQAESLATAGRMRALDQFSRERFNSMLLPFVQKLVAV